LISLLRKIRYYDTGDKKLLESLNNLLGFYPNKLSLYKQALRHKSSKNIVEGVCDSNERLEYLGDAVIGAVIAEYLFKKFPHKDEGYLTKVRSRIVSRENLAGISKKMGLLHLIEKNNDNNIPLKSIGGDAFEALIGAIFLDKGFIKTKHFILDRILKTLVDIDELEEKDTDYKSQIIAWGQKNKKIIAFKLVKEEGYHHKTYHIELWANNDLLGCGIAGSKKKAEQYASQQATEIIKANAIKK